MTTVREVPAPPAAVGGFLGTPAYAAPEQLAGQPVTAAADQFSFCVSLCRALTSKPPFPASAAASPLDASDWTPDPKSLRRLPAALRRLVRRGLSFDPGDRFPSIGSLLGELEAIQGRGRKRRRLAGLAAAAVGAAVLVGLALTWRQAQVCAGGGERFAAVWGDPERRAIKSAFESTGLSYAEASWRGVVGILDRYGERWTEMHRATCRATAVEGVQSAELLDRRMACLDARLYEVSSLVEMLQRGGDIAEYAVTAAGGLGSLAQCADAKALLASTPPPADPVQARAIDELRRRLASAEARLATGDATSGLGRTKSLVDEAEALGYWPTVAEALLLKARFEERLNQPEAADLSLERTLDAAQAGGHDRVAAAAFVHRVRVVGYQRADFERGERYARHADAALTHLGQPQELRAHLDGNLGAVLFEQGRFEDALTAHRAALAAWIDARGAEAPQVGVALARVGDVLLEKGELKPAAER
ncbi:MAG: tetratricopeptide repeat-containing protein kinase family protein, partial [Acidobacteriota bacterium]